MATFVYVVLDSEEPLGAGNAQRPFTKEDTEDDKAPFVADCRMRIAAWTTPRADPPCLRPGALGYYFRLEAFDQGLQALDHF